MATKGHFLYVVRLRFASLVFVRPGELRHAQWEDIDLDKAECGAFWSRKQILSTSCLSARQAVEILKELKPLTGHGQYVFPSARSYKGDRPMSDNAILAAMRCGGRQQGGDDLSRVSGDGTNYSG